MEIHLSSLRWVDIHHIFPIFSTWLIEQYMICKPSRNTLQTQIAMNMKCNRFIYGGPNLIDAVFVHPTFVSILFPFRIIPPVDHTPNTNAPSIYVHFMWCSCRLSANHHEQHIHHGWQSDEPSNVIAERCSRSRINSAIFVSSEGRGFDSIEFLRRHGSQSVLCRKARSAENITDEDRKVRPPMSNSMSPICWLEIIRAPYIMYTCMTLHPLRLFAATIFRESRLGPRGQMPSGDNWIGGRVSRGRSIANWGHLKSYIVQCNRACSQHHSHTPQQQHQRNHNEYESIIDTASTAAHTTAAPATQSNDEIGESADAIDFGAAVRRRHFVTIKLVWAFSVNLLGLYRAKR